MKIVLQEALHDEMVGDAGGAVGVVYEWPTVGLRVG